MTSTETYVDKINKLLAKAESTTPEEAEALTAKAYELMAKYAINKAEIEAHRRQTGAKREDEPIIEQELMLHGIYAPALEIMVHQVVTAFGTMDGYHRDVRVRKHSPSTGNVRLAKAVQYTLVGFQSDVEQTVLLLNSLLLQAGTAHDKWWRQFPGKTYYSRAQQYRIRRQWFISFGQGAASKVKRSVNAAREEASHGAELVLYDRAAQLDAFLENLNLRTRNTRLMGGGDDAREAGFSAGQRANIGDTPVGQTNRRQLS